VPSSWPALPYEEWRETCDTVHAHTQVLGKVAAALAPREPQWQHSALRLTARGWETAPLPTANGTGAFTIALDLHAHDAVVEHSREPRRTVPLTPNRSVAAVTRDVLAAVRDVASYVEIDMTPSETPWQTPLDEDEEHATYDTAHVARYLDAAARAALVLAALRAPYRGRSTPVNAWWGSFDLSVSLFSGAPAEPPSDDVIMRNAMDAQEIAVGWWPGDPRYPHAAFYAYAHPAPDDLREVDASPGRWDGALGEFVLDWDDVVAAPDPVEHALRFARTIVRHACLVCGWDPKLAASVDGDPPPVR
jgi:hypothetical protein